MSSHLSTSALLPLHQWSWLTSGCPIVETLAGQGKGLAIMLLLPMLRCLTV